MAHVAPIYYQWNHYWVNPSLKNTYTHLYKHLCAHCEFLLPCSLTILVKILRKQLLYNTLLFAIVKAEGVTTRCSKVSHVSCKWCGGGIIHESPRCVQMSIQDVHNQSLIVITDGDLCLCHLMQLVHG